MNIKKRKKVWIAAAMFFLVSTAGTKVEAKNIYTGNVKVDTAAERIIESCTKPEMNKKEKLRAVYVHLVKNMEYSHKDGTIRVRVTKNHKMNWKAKEKVLHSQNKVKYSSQFSAEYKNLLTMQGTCKDMSGVMCILANHLGFKAGYQTGRYVRSDGSSTEHWWNYVIINGKKRYFDVQAANDSWDRHRSMPAVMGFCLRDGESSGWKKHHR